MVFLPLGGMFISVEFKSGFLPKHLTTQYLHLQNRGFKQRFK